MSWRHAASVTVPEGAAILREITADFSGPIDDRTQEQQQQVVEVWFQPDFLPSSTNVVLPSLVFSITGSMKLEPERLRWNMSVPIEIVQRAFIPGGRVSIRVHCGFLRDRENRPFSAALDTLTQLESPHVPGGVFESWFFIRRG